MNLHDLDLTPSQFWRAEALQSALLGEVKGSGRQTRSLPPGIAPPIFGSVVLPTAWPTAEQPALGLCFCPPLTGGGVGRGGGGVGTQRAHLLIQELSPDEIFNLISMVPLACMLTFLGSKD